MFSLKCNSGFCLAGNRMTTRTFREQKNSNNVESFSTLFLMPTLRWITEKKLKRVIENKGDEVRRKTWKYHSGGEKMRNTGGQQGEKWAAVKTKGRGTQATKFLVITYDNSSKKWCVTKKFHVLVVQNNRKEMCKKVCYTCKFVFLLLIRSVDFDAVLIAVALKGATQRCNVGTMLFTVTIRNNIATMLQHCVALKIFVANRRV